MIRLATPSDIAKVVNIHSQSLPEDYLPKLGKKVMHGYYKTFMKKNPIILFEEKECIVGFVALSIYPINLKSIFIRYYKIIMMKLFLQPDLWHQALWLTLNSKRHNDGYPEISFVAVKKEYRGVGIGSQLITWICNFVSKKGIEYLRVKTEAASINTNCFYKKNMFRFVSTEKRFNRIFNVYLREVKVVNS
jgi:ribosomal protein S18 acetylase RimI-like enzyme